MDKLESNRKTDHYCGNGIAYEVIAPYIMRKCPEGKTPKVVIMSDREVSGYYYNRFEEQFLKLRIKPILVSNDCRNNNKGLSTLDTLFKNLVEFDLGRNDWLIALGGGGVLDICGFAASVFTGGINFLAVPTTMCAMTEGVLARKSYLNSVGHKSEITSGFAPDVVIVDPTFLGTVPQKVSANGYASIMRIAMLKDLDLIAGVKTRSDFRVYLNEIYKARAAIEHKDPELLLMGKELADAIESYFRFMNYSEGEALALSLLSIFAGRKREAFVKIYEALGLPTRLEGCTSKMIMKTLSDSFEHRGLTKVKLVCPEEAHFRVVEMSVPEELELLGRRLQRIMDT